MPFSLDDVRLDLRDGMPSQVREAWDCYRANTAYYRMRNREFLEQAARKESEEMYDWDRRPKQYSRMTRRAVRCLTGKLYTPAPHRHFAGPAADVLDAVCRESRIDSVMHSLDTLATLNGYAAVQIVATGDPDKPVRCYLWDASEFWPYFTDDDPMHPVCVVTRSVVPGVRRGTRRCKWEVWTAELYESWFGKDFNPYDASASSWGGTTATQVADRRVNTYRTIPFAFAWNELPVDRFEVEGIGTALRETNAEVDRMLTDLAHLIEWYNRPQGFVRNVPASWRHADRVGRFARLPQGGDKDDVLGPPEVFYLQPSVDVAQAWDAIGNLIDQTFSDLDIPLEAARGGARWSGSVAASGIALAIRNEPLRAYVEDRRQLFELYERDLFRVVLSVLGHHHDVTMLTDEAGSLELDIQWPEVTFGPVGTDQQQTDQWSYQMGLDSRITILMRQRGISRDEAVEHLEQVAEDLEREKEILGIEGDAPDPNPPAPGQQPPQPDPQQSGPLTTDAESGPGEDDMAGEGD